MNLEELKQKKPAELINEAEKLGIENPSTLRKQEILFSILVVSTSNLILSLGYSGVKLSKAILFLPCSGLSKLILLTFKRAKYLLLS
jgi:hypothetical protein